MKIFNFDIFLIHFRKKLLDKLDAIDETIGSQADISELNDAVNNLYKNVSFKVINLESKILEYLVSINFLI